MELKCLSLESTENTPGLRPAPSYLLCSPFTSFHSIYKWHIPGRGAMALTLWTAINLSRASCLFQARLTTAVQLTPIALPGVSGVPDDQQNVEEVSYITSHQGS